MKGFLVMKIPALQGQDPKCFRCITDCFMTFIVDAIGVQEVTKLQKLSSRHVKQNAANSRATIFMASIRLQMKGGSLKNSWRRQTAMRTLHKFPTSRCCSPTPSTPYVSISAKINFCWMTQARSCGHSAFPRYFRSTAPSLVRCPVWDTKTLRLSGVWSLIGQKRHLDFLEGRRLSFCQLMEPIQGTQTSYLWRTKCALPNQAFGYKGIIQVASPK